MDNALESIQQDLKALRADLQKEFSQAKRQSRVIAFIAMFGTVAASAISGYATYVVAKGRLDEIAAQSRAQMETTSQQKLLEQVFTQDNVGRLRDSLAMLILGNLVSAKTEEGICALVMAYLDDPPDECRKAAILIVKPLGRQTSQTKTVVTSALDRPTPASTDASSSPSATVKIAPAILAEIINLGADQGGTRQAAADDLISKLDDRSTPLTERLSILEAIVQTTTIDTYLQLNLNARYNTFVVLSEIQALKAEALASNQKTKFTEITKRLVANARRIKDLAAQDPTIAGQKTMRQVDQVIDRLG